MSSFRILRYPVLFGLALGITVVVLIAMSYSDAIPGQRFTVGTASGRDYIAHNSDYEVTATLPATLSDEVILPMTLHPDFGAGMLYQGQQSLERSIIGNRVTFTMQAVGSPGDTITIVLVRLNKAQAMLIQHEMPIGSSKLVDTSRLKRVTVVATYDLIVVGA